MKACSHFEEMSHADVMNPYGENVDPVYEIKSNLFAQTFSCFAAHERWLQGRKQVSNTQPSHSCSHYF
jgi:hypothetical protein